VTHRFGEDLVRRWYIPQVARAASAIAGSSLSCRPSVGEPFGPGDFVDACGLSEHRLSHPQFAKTLTTEQSKQQSIENIPGKSQLFGR
jgi:hypothetical protein